MSRKPTGPDRNVADAERLRLEEGAELVARTKVYGSLELFLFSAASWHPHRVHYDQLYTTEVEGHDGVLVHGPLQAVHLVDALVAALDEDWTVRSVHYRHLAALHVGEGVELRGRVHTVGAAGGEATVELWMEKLEGGARTTTVTAVVGLLPAHEERAAP